MLLSWDEDLGFMDDAQLQDSCRDASWGKRVKTSGSRELSIYNVLKLDLTDQDNAKCTGT